MRKSVIAGLTLCAALAVVAGQAQADNDRHGAPAVKRVHDGHKQARQMPEMPETQFRIPAHPIIRDCVHVMFPQCSRGFDGLNDGSFK